MRSRELSFAHLLRLSDDVGVFEHADGSVPSRQHGYCVDDVSRALIVVMREDQPDAAVSALGDLCLRFLLRAQGADGQFHNRLGYDRKWHDAPGTGDWWGRALWAVGTAAAHHPDPSSRESARRSFARGARWRSPFPRAMAFAALGAAEIDVMEPGDAGARGLLAAAVTTIGAPARAWDRDRAWARDRACARDRAWPWPEPRLTYANAVLPDAMLAAGTALADDRLVDTALLLLGWLLEIETGEGHLSLTAVGGWGPGEPRRRYDQQPIEAATLAEACARAFAGTGDRRWSRGIDLAAAWFDGDNDAHLSLLDASSGGGYDGLTPSGCNTNQGAESTLALIATVQHARRAARAEA